MRSVLKAQISLVPFLSGVVVHIQRGPFSWSIHRTCLFRQVVAFCACSNRSGFILRYTWCVICFAADQAGGHQIHRVILASTVRCRGRRYSSDTGVDVRSRALTLLGRITKIQCRRKQEPVAFDSSLITSACHLAMFPLPSLAYIRL